MIKWISIKDFLPEKQGKYVVKTTSPFGTNRKIEAMFIKNKNNGTFDVNNQTVTHWLKEE